MTIILGIDPGSRRTGYGVIRVMGHRHLYLSSGVIDVSHHPMCERLRIIHATLRDIIGTYQPQEAAIEQVFMHENPNAALKLGQARGAALVALDMPVSEYAAREVKKSVVGHGGAKKDQVQYMVRRLLCIQGELQEDAADALAIALCHAHMKNLRHLLSKAGVQGTVP